ncbi:hypothetical protein Syun_021125 [Stephania yunnanensis]|uniref:C2 tensin-type domain-containing protein n=1 Tax=Stephania yunnanensis TaxID=152371 RepID=A0AAP0IF81_9MAGN
MALFRRFFYRKPPDRLLEISERVYVFDCCFSTDVMEEDEYKVYLDGIVAQLQDQFPDASFMVFNFKEGERRSQISDILSNYDMTIMDYPRQYEGCPLLPLEMIHHFLKSSESWLSLEGQQNVLLMHCERGGWPVLAFMLAGLLLYRKQYSGEQKTLEMVYKQAPRELLHLLTPLNPQPSQTRYLQYICRRNLGPDWPPMDTSLIMDSLHLKFLPVFVGERGCMPVVRVYGQDPSNATTRSSKILFSTPKTRRRACHYRQAECRLLKIDIHCRVQGDIVLECINLDEDLVREEMIFRVMFNTTFIRSNILTLSREEVDVLWDAKEQFPKDFKAEVLFSDPNSSDSVITREVISEEDDEGEHGSEEFFEVEEIFVDVQDGRGDLDLHTVTDRTLANGGHIQMGMGDSYADAIQHRKTDSGDSENSDFYDVRNKASEDGSGQEDGEEDVDLRAVRTSTVDDTNPQDDTFGNLGLFSDQQRTRDNGNSNLEPETSDTNIGNVVDGNTITDVLSRFEEQNNGATSENFMSEVVHHKLNTEAFGQKSEKLLLPISKKQIAFQKSEEMDSEGTLSKSTLGKILSRWVPPNKIPHAYSQSRFQFHPPARYDSAPAALDISSEDVSDAEIPNIVPSGLVHSSLGQSSRDKLSLSPQSSNSLEATPLHPQDVNKSVMDKFPTPPFPPTPSALIHWNKRIVKSPRKIIVDSLVPLSMPSPVPPPPSHGKGVAIPNGSATTLSLAVFPTPLPVPLLGAPNVLRSPPMANNLHHHHLHHHHHLLLLLHLHLLLLLHLHIFNHLYLP